MLKGTGILREQNKRTVLSYIRKMKATSRKDLAEKMGVSKNTISLVVDKLLSEHIVIEADRIKPGAKGRPKQVIELNKNGYKSIGISVIETSIKYAVINYYGEIIEEEVIPFDATDFHATDVKLKELIDTLLTSHSKVLGVGIAIPGIVNTKEKIVYKSVRLGWENQIFKQVQMVNVSVMIQNSVNMTALSALENGSQIEGSFFYIHIGNGVGGAYISENTIVEGGSWTAGEIGHVSVDPNGPVCICGQNGCLEQLIGLQTFKEFLEIQGEIHIYQQMLTSQVDNISPATQQMLKQYGEYLGRAIIPIIHLLNPNHIIISTPYKSFDIFRETCFTYMRNNALDIPYNNTVITFAKSKFSKSLGAGLAVIHMYEREYQV